MNDGKTRLDDIMVKAFRDDLCSFQEAITIILSVHQLGTLEPIGHLETARQKLVAHKDGSVANDDAFLDMYDWVYVRDRLKKYADSIAPASGPDESPNDMAQDLESLARWIRLSGKDMGWDNRCEPHITP